MRRVVDLLKRARSYDKGIRMSCARRGGIAKNRQFKAEAEFWLR